LIRNHGTLVCVGLPRSGNPLPISPFWMCVRSELSCPALPCGSLSLTACWHLPESIRRNCNLLSLTHTQVSRSWVRRSERTQKCKSSCRWL
jgi:hypothetical protein